jgi:RNA polymerase sigma factor (sigma-70 family)
LNLSEEDIRQLIKDCIKNDRKAQERLYKSYYRVLINLCLRYCKEESDALAVLNIGFYKVFKNLGQYDASKAQLYTWMRRIIINECFNHLRLEKGKISQVDLDKDTDLSIEPDVFAKIKETAVLSLIHRLPNATKAVFNLFIIEGFSHREISQMLDISEGTSKWHLNDARKKLQTMLLNQRENN